MASRMTPSSSERPINGHVKRTCKAYERREVAGPQTAEFAQSVSARNPWVALAWQP
jgi:hypothetical protein